MKLLTVAGASCLLVLVVGGCGQRDRELIQEQTEEIAGLKSEMLELKITAETKAGELAEAEKSILALKEEIKTKTDAMIVETREKLAQIEGLKVEARTIDGEFEKVVAEVEEAGKKYEMIKQVKEAELKKLNEVVRLVEPEDWEGIEGILEIAKGLETENAELKARIAELEKK